MYRATLFLSGFAVLVCSALIWSAELVFPKSAASAIVLVTATVLGLWIVRPGWHLQPRQSGRNLPVLFGLLLASAAGAAWFLIFFEVPLPYDVSTLNVVASIPAILVIAGIEELLFRQVMYRWLEQRGGLNSDGHRRHGTRLRLDSPGASLYRKHRRYNFLSIAKRVPGLDRHFARSNQTRD